MLAAVLVVLQPPATAADPGPNPEIGAQWHATWASETDTSRARELDTLKQNGVGWVRIDVGWPMIQPQRGEFDTGWGVPFVEKQIDAARARGLKVLVTFWRTPGWANGDKSAVTLPNDPQDYADALGYVVQRWKGKVAAWEIWNEPNTVDFMNPPDPIRYAALLRAAYKSAKAADPAAKVLFGGTMYVDTDWIERVYAAGVSGSFDIMGVHPYMGKADAPPETKDTGDRWNMTHVDALVELMRAHGDADKPIWFTEFGWSVHANDADTAVWARGVNEAQQADFLGRTVELVRNNWPQVRTIIWYNSRDKATGDAHQDGFGLMRRDFSPRPVLDRIRSIVSDSDPADLSLRQR